MEISESILQKVQKLQALAERAGTPEEAANATARISEILLKYNLDLGTVKDYKPVDKNDVIYERHNLNDYQTYHDGDFALNLVRAIARFNFCKVIHNNLARTGIKRDQGDFTIIGQAHNVQIVMYMYDYCINNIKIMANDGWKTYDKSETKIKTVYVRHFFDGAVVAIRERLYRQEKQQQETHGENMYAMVKYNDAAVESKVCELFPRLRTVATKSQANSGIKLDGYHAGKSMNLSKGMDYTPQKRLS